ncbi:sigma-54 interaction domain-containing protein [Natranaerobius trueperi]|uniref:Sigma-54-dependent Fis family transcriptional regulator n=1 Tax=Natranaerobius trueperi TaxID=759412 RepID=A0A226BW58_9FIRM|nr:sigma 54-interacting transcriptional regulator [Natranaerobius trueperi]OWZ83141.1 sigma-54-dependent Fis family transcriptional regulator [Natranaerobius trueperi]
MKTPVAIYKKILDNLEEGVHVIDIHGRSIFYNNRMSKLEGLDPEQVIEKPLLDVFPGLSTETSTLLKVLKYETSIKNRLQTYLTITGKQVMTINSTYPIELNGKVVGACEIAKDVTELKEMSEEISQLRQKVSIEENEDQFRREYTNIIGKSEKIIQLLEHTEKVSNTPSNVLIYGETGTGKELFARKLHNDSRRNKGPFIAQNCAALPAELIEGILFGTVKGSFTGAVNRPGLFQQAHKGTLLLDEIHTLPLHLQAKLLRVVEEGEIRPLGGQETQKADVKVIATMNTDPLEAVEKGEMRTDLYYRLSVVNLYLPPLRDRKDDIFPLVNYFLKKYQYKFNKTVLGIDPSLLDQFETYSWPGNIRELEHAIEGAMNVIEENETISFEHIPYILKQRLSSKGQAENNIEKCLCERNLIEETLSKRLENVERYHIQKALKENNKNVSKAAESLGLTRQALQYKLKKFDLVQD